MRCVVCEAWVGWWVCEKGEWGVCVCVVGSVCAWGVGTNQYLQEFGFQHFFPQVYPWPTDKVLGTSTSQKHSYMILYLLAKLNYFTVIRPLTLATDCTFCSPDTLPSFNTASRSCLEQKNQVFYTRKKNVLHSIESHLVSEVKSIKLLWSLCFTVLSSSPIVNPESPMGWFWALIFNVQLLILHFVLSAHVQEAESKQAPPPKRDHTRNLIALSCVRVYVCVCIYE